MLLQLDALAKFPKYGHLVLTETYGAVSNIENCLQSNCLQYDLDSISF